MLQMVVATFKPPCRWVTIASFFFSTNLMLHQRFSLGGVNTCVGCKSDYAFFCWCATEALFPFSWAFFTTFVTILDSSLHSLIILILTETKLCIS